MNNYHLAAILVFIPSVLLWVYASYKYLTMPLTKAERNYGKEEIYTDLMLDIPNDKIPRPYQKNGLEE